MRLAKLRVKDQLRANNLRIKDYEYAELTQLAWVWFSEHRAELLGYATIELLFAAERNSKYSHKRSMPKKSMASAVQILGAK
jgi:hypothetical protein